MGNAGAAGRSERRLDGSCASEAEGLLAEMVGGEGSVAAVGAPVVVAAIGLAIQRGVRIVIVVVGDVERVGEVAEELRALAGPMVFASSEPQVWETDLAHIRKHVGARGILVACARNARHLDRVRELIERIDGGMYPALVIEENPEALVSARTRARLGELRRLLWRVTMRG